MAVNNSVFNTNTVISNSQISRLSTLDTNNMDSDSEKEFNTYKYWTPFYVPGQPVISGKTDSKGNPTNENTGQGKGTKSLFSNFNALYVDEQYRESANMPLLDNPQSRLRTRQNTDCTIKDLVEASENGEMGRQVYSYADFAYCKYLGRVPNNYLITLRRFAAPCGDKIDITPNANTKSFEKGSNGMQGHAPDIGRMITWMGTPGNEMGNVLKYSVKFNYEEKSADIETQQGSEDNGGPLAAIFNTGNASYRKQVQQGVAGTNYAGKKFVDSKLGGSSNPPYAGWDAQYDKVKVYGPLDVIDKTTIRKRGLELDHQITLTFDYEMRSYGGVNGKAAFMDLLSNILATTYSVGTFWGGERRFIGAAQDNVFANLPIFKLADQGGLSSPGAVYKALTDSIQQGAKAVAGGLEGDTTWEKIKSGVKELGGMMLGQLLNKLGRPQRYTFASLLSPAPTGCWHLTVGNPKAPIIETGNLLLENATIEHYGPLGLDDFPTGLRVTVTLKPGKSRDIMGIEQMYMRGEDRIYAPMGREIMTMYKNAKEINSKKNSTDINTTINTSVVNDSTKDIDTQDVSQSIINVSKETKSTNADLSSGTKNVLMKYFGIDNETLIVNTANESLYGAEAHKNDHVKK